MKITGAKKELKQELLRRIERLQDRIVELEKENIKLEPVTTVCKNDGVYEQVSTEGSNFELQPNDVIAVTSDHREELAVQENQSLLFEKTAVKILLVGDDEARITIISRAFERNKVQGCNLTIASDLREANACLAESLPDLAIVNWLLPDGKGIELLSGDTKEAVFPTIIISSHGDEQLTAESIKMGAFEYIVKSESMLADLPHFSNRILRAWQDITTRKHTEEQLLILSRAVEQNPTSVVITNVKGKIEYVNPKFCQLTGYSFDEVIGKNPRVLKSGETRREEYKKLWNTIKTGGEWRGELHNKKKNGKLFWETASISAIKNTDGVITHYLAVKEDITERKRIEKVLEESYEQTEQLLSCISSILIGVDRNDEITRWNTSAEDTFNIKAKDAIGKQFRDCGIQWDWAAVLEGLSDGMDDAEPIRIDNVRFTRKDAKDGFLGITISPIAEAGMEQAGYLLMAADITERRILEGQLTQAQKLESIGQLAAGIAHEINTPIQYIGDNTRFLKVALDKLRNTFLKHNELLATVKQNAVTDQLIAEVEAEIDKNKIEYILEQIPQAIEDSLDGIKRVSKIVKAMKEFSHPGSDEKTPIDLNRTLESTITVCRNEWKYHANMEQNFDPELPLVPCLPGELNQVILNMLVNAAHAIADVVNDEPDKKGVIKVSTHNRKDWAEIKISDTGAGIPKEHQNKIFDHFFTTKEVGKGTGQGLAISHNVIVEKHGGAITFVSEKGKGTTFVIRLPITASSAKDQEKTI